MHNAMSAVRVEQKNETKKKEKHEESQKRKT